MSAGDVAASVKKDVDIVLEWEAGQSYPTYAQLEKLAYTTFKRPLAIFFFPHPPNEPDQAQEFRTLPEFERQNLSPDTRFAVRQAEVMRLSLEELSDGVNPARNRIFEEVSVSSETTPNALAKEVRKYLGISLFEQTSWANPDEALKRWRKAIELYGIFVFKRSFKQKDISGFCLVDKNFPIIYLNNSTSFARQIFTLFHELGHVLMDANGVTKDDQSYIDNLKPKYRKIEIFVNAFAAEFLVPTEDLQKSISAYEIDSGSVLSLASKYNVSVDVIMRRLLSIKVIDEERYTEFYTSRSFKLEKARGSNTGSGGNYYNTQLAYLGDSYLEYTFGKYNPGHIGLEKLADCLNVKPTSVPGLELALLRRASS